MTYLTEYDNQKVCKRCKEKIRTEYMNLFWIRFKEIINEPQLTPNKIQPISWRGSRKNREI